MSATAPVGGEFARIEGEIRKAHASGRPRKELVLMIKTACGKVTKSEYDRLFDVLDECGRSPIYVDPQAAHDDRAGISPPRIEGDATVAESSGRLRLRALADVQPQSVKWLVPGMIPLHALTLVAGVGGLGKSTWLLGVAAKGSRGGFGDPWDTILVSFEDPAAEVLRPRVEAARGDINRIHEVVFTDAASLDTVSLPRDVDELRNLTRQKGARLIVIDPVVAAFEMGVDTYKDQHVRSVLAQLVGIAEEEHCAIAMVGHLTKGQSSDAYMRVANSGAFWNAARSVVLVTEDRAEDCAGDDDVRLVAQRKANWAKRGQIERWRLEEIVLPERLDPETGAPIVTSRMVFVEHATDVDGEELLAPRKANKTEGAQQALRSMLADGEWHESDGLKKLLAAQELSGRTVQRAAKDLGVEVDHRGFPQKTWWRLPFAPSLPSAFGANGNIAQPSGFATSYSPVAPNHVGVDATGANGHQPDGRVALLDACPVCASTDIGATTGNCHRCGNSARRQLEGFPA